MGKHFFIALALLSVAPGLLLAQLTTGTINGTIADDTGAILPGVTVALKGDAIVGTHTAVSNEQGFYRFAALPPGTYTLTFTLSGMATVNRDVRVPLGRVVEEDVPMKLSQMTEEVTVQAEAPVVDAQTNQVGTNYDKDWVRNAPVNRVSFFDFINAAPGVNQSTGGSVVSTSFGSGTTDNSYQLDGTDFTSPSIGEAWPYPNTDAIEEVEVLSLGAPAEYGNMLGSVFNIVTRQGTNAFHGDVNYYFQRDALTGKNTTPAQDSCADALGNLRPCPYHRDKFDDLTLQFEGPIIKDKLWFFASYQYQKDTKSLAGSAPENPQFNKSDRMFIKLNYQLNAKNKVMLAYHNDYYNLSCVTSQACSSSIAPSAQTLDHGNNPSPNVTYTYLASDKTFFEARVSGFYGKDHGDPRVTGEAERQPRFFDAVTGQITGGIFSFYDGDVWRTGATAKVSHFADKFLGGSHDLKFGVQFNEGGSQYTRGVNDYVYTYSGVPASATTQAPHHVGGKETTTGVFLDDSFRVNSRLTLNLGVRYDHARASFQAEPILDASGNPTGQSSAAVDNLFTWNVVSPRVGFSLKLTADGKTAFKGHYGRYYRGIITNEFETAAPTVPPVFNFSGTYDASGNPIGLSPSGSPSLTVNPSIRAPYTDQYIVQVEREVIKDLGVALNYIHKDGREYAAFQDTTGVYTQVPFADPVTGQIYQIFSRQSDPTKSVIQLTNPSGMLTKYNGVTLQLTKRMSHHWQLVGSLVISKTKGRVVSSLGGPADEPTAALLSGQTFEGTFGQNPNDFINTNGLLISDRPVTGKVQFVGELPWGFLVGLNFTHQSGRPWERVIFLPQSITNVAPFASGSLLLTQPISGNQRVGDWNILDMRLQKSFALNGKGANLSFFADALNLFNNKAFDDVGSRVTGATNFGIPVSFVQPRRLMLGAKFTF
jgi:outer membrane receptor protein involved in Fe transport